MFSLLTFVGHICSLKFFINTAMSKVFLPKLNLIVIFIETFLCALLLSPVFAEESQVRSTPIEVIVKGKVFPSLKEYEQSKVAKEMPMKKKGGGVPWAVKAMTDLPAKLIPAWKGSLQEVHKATQKSPVFRGGIDENGWKTVVLDKNSPDTSRSQGPAKGDYFREVGGNTPSLPLPTLMPEQAVAIQRILGISPSMNAVVKDFEDGSAVPVGTGLIKVSTEDELADQLRAMASGMDGPFLLIFSHNRVRLMGLKSDSSVEPKK